MSGKLGSVIGAMMAEARKLGVSGTAVCCRSDLTFAELSFQVQGIGPQGVSSVIECVDLGAQLIELGDILVNYGSDSITALAKPGVILDGWMVRIHEGRVYATSFEGDALCNWRRQIASAGIEAAIR